MQTTKICVAEAILDWAKDGVLDIPIAVIHEADSKHPFSGSQRLRELAAEYRCLRNSTPYIYRNHYGHHYHMSKGFVRFLRAWLNRQYKLQKAA